MNLYQKHLVHFIGVGGVGMSGLAQVLLSSGIKVTGSDIKKSAFTEKLELMGGKIFMGHQASHVHGADLVVYSSCINEAHPERQEACRLGLQVIHRSELLALLCEDKKTVAVSGAHGKTTTTAMIGALLAQAGHDPMVIVGGFVDSWNGNVRIGRGETVVIEADESDSSFLNLACDIEVITNIDKEHMDHFKNMEAVEQAYRRFINRLKPGGRWVGCGDDVRIHALLQEESFEGLSYGLSKHNLVRAESLRLNGAKTRFECWFHSEKLGELALNVPGTHNVYNALGAIGAGLLLGIPFETMRVALEGYRNVKRRFEVKYHGNSIFIVDDYAHHPTEIKSTVETSRQFGARRIMGVFQPHRYSRAQYLKDLFCDSFKGVDTLVVTDIYAASEKPIEGVSGQMLCDGIRQQGHPSTLFVGRHELFSYLIHEIREGDLVLLVGAGDITEVSDQLRDYYQRQNGQC